MGRPDQSPQASLAILVLSGDMEKGLAACNLALAAAATGSRVTLFFSFWGLDFLKIPGGKPTGSFLQRLLGGLNRDDAGRQRMGRLHLMGAGRWAMGRLMRRRGVPTVVQGLRSAHAMGARLVACSTTLDLMGLSRESLIPEVDDIAGAATFLEEARGAVVVTLS